MKLAKMMSAVLVVTAGASSTVSRAPEDDELCVGSSYLTVPIEMDQSTARGVTISGKLGGRAELILDPNSCSLDLFGDPVICTQMAIFPRTVRLQRVDIPDPLELGRRLYEIQGVAGPEVNYLVVPRNTEDPHHLVQTDDSGYVERVVRLD